MTAKETEERYLRIRPGSIQTAINTIYRELNFQPPEGIVIDGKLFHQWNIYMGEMNRRETEFVMNYCEILGFTVIPDDFMSDFLKKRCYLLHIRF